MIRLISVSFDDSKSEHIKKLYFLINKQLAFLWGPLCSTSCLLVPFFIRGWRYPVSYHDDWKSANFLVQHQLQLLYMYRWWPHIAQFKAWWRKGDDFTLIIVNVCFCESISFSTFLCNIYLQVFMIFQTLHFLITFFIMVRCICIY